MRSFQLLPSEREGKVDQSLVQKRSRTRPSRALLMGRSAGRRRGKNSTARAQDLYAYSYSPPRKKEIDIRFPFPIRFSDLLYCPTVYYLLFN